jgi:uncharacterized membrane protein (DUF106 family)
MTTLQILLMITSSVMAGMLIGVIYTFMILYKDLKNTKKELDIMEQYIEELLDEKYNRIDQEYFN